VHIIVLIYGTEQHIMKIKLFSVMCITVKILLQYKCMKPETFRLYDQPARSKKYENLELGMTKIDKSENRTKTLA